MSHAAWLAGNRLAMRRIVEGTPGRVNVFRAEFPGYGGSRVGLRIEYAAGRDLTASLLESWLAHEDGGTPNFYLGDAMTAAGEQWDDEVAALVWPRLYAKGA